MGEVFYKTFFLTYLLGILCLSLLSAQPPPKTLYFNSLDQRQHLPPGGIMNFYEDSKGYLWLCTGGGLCRYDGKNLEVFKAEPNNINSLSESGINDITEDKQGKLWISTRGGGLNCFNPTTGQFQHFRHNEADSTSLSNDYLKHIVIDDEGMLWIGDDTGGGLNRFNPITGKNTRYVPQRGVEGKLQGTVFSEIIPDGDRIYLGTTAGFEYFDKKTGQFRFFPFFQENGKHHYYNLYAMCKDRNGKVWIDAPNAGFRIYDPVTDSIISNVVPEIVGTPKTYLNRMAEDINGTLWMVGNNRFMVFIGG